MKRYIRSAVRPISDEDYTTRWGTANDKHLRGKELEVLATDPSEQVRFIVAKNPNTPESILRKLYKDKSSMVVHGVAANPNLPKDLLKGFLQSADELVPVYLAENPNLPESVIRTLWDSGEARFDTQWNLASNPCTPVDILSEMVHDPRADLSNRAANNPNAYKL